MWFSYFWGYLFCNQRNLWMLFYKGYISTAFKIIVYKTDSWWQNDLNKLKANTK